MEFEFSLEKADEISRVLGIPYKKTGHVVRFEVEAESGSSKIAVEILLGLQVESKVFNIVSVYSAQAFIQLHNCTGFVASELLGQVTFFARNGNQTSGLIVDKTGGCNIYSNVEDSILRADFTKLPTELMMCSVALSLTDTLDPDFTFDEDAP